MLVPFLYFTDHHFRWKFFFFTLKNTWYSVENNSICIVILKCHTHVQTRTHTIYIACKQRIWRLKISKEPKLVAVKKMHFYVNVAVIVHSSKMSFPPYNYQKLVFSLRLKSNHIRLRSSFQFLMTSEHPYSCPVHDQHWVNMRSKGGRREDSERTGTEGTSLPLDTQQVRH